MMSVSIWRQHNVDTMTVDVSMHYIRRTFIIIYLRRQLYANVKLLSIWRQLNDVNIDKTPTQRRYYVSRR